MCSSCIQGQYNERSLYCPWCIDIASFNFVENRVLTGLHLYTPKSAPGRGQATKQCIIIFQGRINEEKLNKNSASILNSCQYNN